MKVDTVIIRPILTEKATNKSAKKTYMFEVHQDATKPQIRRALEKLYGVSIGEVNVVNRIGKTRRVGRKMKTKQLPARKLAYVLVTGGSIDLFPQA